MAGLWGANKAAEIQRRDAATQADIDRRHAEAMADKQHAAELEAQKEASKAHDRVARSEVYLSASSDALAAVGRLRAALNASAAATAYTDQVTPVPSETVSAFTSSVLRAQLVLTDGFLDHDVEDIVSTLSDYMQRYVRLKQPERAEAVAGLMPMLRQVEDGITTAYNTAINAD